MTQKQRVKLRLDCAMRQGGICYWCGKKMGEITLDHIKPLHLGGADSAKNCVASCKHCNQQKSNHTAPEFIRRKLLDVQAFMNSEGFKRYVGVKK